MKIEEIDHENVNYAPCKNISLHCAVTVSEGQLISEWIFDVINFPKNQLKNLMKLVELKKIKVLLYINHVKYVDPK